MLKRLTVLLRWKYPVAVALILIGSVYVSRQYQNASEQCEKECAKFNGGVVPPATHADDCEECEKNAERHLPRWYGAFSWPEGITTWAILLTLMVIAEQTHQTRRAADSGAEAANAAFGSVTFAQAQWELTKEKERARLDVKGGGLSVEIAPVEDAAEESWHLKVTMRARNIGASRAFVIQSPCQILVKAKDGAFPEPDGYRQVPFADSFFDPGDTFVDLPFHWFPDSGARIRHLAEDLHDSRRSIHLYGLIDYETLGMRFRKEFGFVWTVMDPAFWLGGLVGQGAEQTDDAKVTFGYWLPDPDRDKPEYPIGREQQDQPEKAN